MTHVASHGFVILAPFKLNWPAAQYHAEWMIELHNWCQDNVMDILNAEVDSFAQSFARVHGAATGSLH